MKEHRQRRLKLLLVSELLKKRKNAIKRKFWVNKLWLKRKSQGCYNNLVKEMEEHDPDKYFNYHRMDPAAFRELAKKLRPTLMKLCLHREVISVEERLSLTLRYLASGNSMVSIAYQYRIGSSTVSQTIKTTCVALWDILSPEVFPTFSTEYWYQTAKNYGEKCIFPFCLGAIDGKHCNVQAFPNSGSKNFNYKGTHSVVLLGVCDASYKFISVDIGAAGRFSDGGIFKNTHFGNAVCNASTVLNLPKPENIDGLSEKVPYVFVGDEAFPLLENLMRPFPGRAKGLLKNDAIFNYRLSRARRLIENTFGILAARWRIYRGTIIASPSTALGIIKATVVLHNWLTNKSTKYCPPGFADHENESGSMTEGVWRQEIAGANGWRSVPKMGSNNYALNPKEIRDQFKKYFSEINPLPWQENRIYH